MSSLIKTVREKKETALRNIFPQEGERFKLVQEGEDNIQ